MYAFVWFLGKGRSMDSRQSPILGPLARTVGVVLVSWMSLAPAAFADWSSPVDVSADGQNADSHQAAIDPNGNAVVVWRRTDGATLRVQAQARTAGSFGPVHNVSGAGYTAGTPQVAMDGSGNAIFVWSRLDGSNFRIETRSLSTGGVLSAIQILMDAQEIGGAPQLAMDGNGTAIVVWSRYLNGYSRVQLRTRSVAGALGATKTLTSGGGDASTPQVAVNAAGNGVIVWRRFDGLNYRIQIVARSSAGALGAVRTVSVAGQNADSPNVAVDSAGGAVVVWRRFDGALYRIQTLSRSAAGALGVQQTVSEAGQNAGAGPQAGIDSSGNSVMVWHAWDGTGTRAQILARSAAGILSAVQTLSGPGASPPQVVVDAAGNAVAAWHRFNGGFLRVEARRRSADGTLDPVETLTPLGQDAVYPDLAGNSAGMAVGAWGRSGTPYTRIAVAVGP